MDSMHRQDKGLWFWCHRCILWLSKDPNMSLAGPDWSMEGTGSGTLGRRVPGDAGFGLPILRHTPDVRV